MPGLFSLSSYKIPYALIVITFNAIQGDSGGNVNIVGGDGIGCSEKNSTNEHVPNSECLPRPRCLNLQIQKHCEW